MLSVALAVGMVFAASGGLLEIIVGGDDFQPSGHHDGVPADPQPDRGPTTTTPPEETTTTTTPPTTQVTTTTTTTTSASPPTTAAFQTTTTAVNAVIEQTRGSAAGSSSPQGLSPAQSPPSGERQPAQAPPSQRLGTSGAAQAQPARRAAPGPDELPLDLATGPVVPMAGDAVIPEVPGGPATTAPAAKARSVAAGALPPLDTDRGLSLRIPAPFLIALLVTLLVGAIAFWRDRRPT